MFSNIRDCRITLIPDPNVSIPPGCKAMPTNAESILKKEPAPYLAESSMVRLGLKKLNADCAEASQFFQTCLGTLLLASTEQQTRMGTMAAILCTRNPQIASCYKESFLHCPSYYNCVLKKANFK